MSTTPNSSQKPAEEPVRSRIARYDEYFNLRTFSVALRKTNRPVKDLSKKKPVLVVRRIINHKGQLDRIDVDIKSAALANVLIDIHRNVDGLRLSLAEPEADPELFFHSFRPLKRKLVEEEAKENPNQSLIDDIKVALQFIHEENGQTMADFDRLTSNNEMTYELLWALFPPNTLIYRRHEFTDQDQILLSKLVSWKKRADGTPYCEVSADIINNDGSSFGLARDILEIDFYGGGRKIQDLPFYPLEFHKDSDTLYKFAVTRGKRFVRIDKQGFEISGHAMREQRNEQYEVKHFRFHTYGRVMIDPVAFRTFEPNVEFNISVHTRLDKEELEENQYAICTPIVLGFCFGVKMWGGFAMDRLRDIQWSDEAFSSLVLGAKQKRLIHALVKQHNARSQAIDDVIQGKGQGLIGLLCGNPGSGKTLTAEAVAEATRRHLYVVSAGDLGTEPEKVDKNLSRTLELAHMWDAILLLDEAEVFLQVRSMTDVTRNALVSIFLRQLEYYPGILILTTNLVSHCDPAFESRIHFSIHYPDLDFNSRKIVWNTFLSKATKNSTKFLDGDVERLAKMIMNGRQIKNTVMSAQSIAMDMNAPLSVEHIDTVLEVVSDWEKAAQIMARKVGTT